MRFLAVCLIPLLVQLVSCLSVTPLQDVSEAAIFARKLVKDTGIGTILTLVDASVNPKFAGFPFGMMEYYQGNCFTNGDLLLFMSDLQLNARNMHKQPDMVGFSIRALKEYDNPKIGNKTAPVQSPRVTLLGHVTLRPTSERATDMECFSLNHPEAQPWQHFRDFKFYRLTVESVYYVGGFGGLNYIGWIPLDVYHNVEGVEYYFRVQS